MRFPFFVQSRNISFLSPGALTGRSSLLHAITKDTEETRIKKRRKVIM